MSIESLKLEQFTAFEKAFFEFSPGINVFIGANSTGKTHLMKLLYSLLKTCEMAHREQLNSRDKIAARLSEKLVGVFKPNQVDRLIRRAQGQRKGWDSLNSYTDSAVANMVASEQGQRTGLATINYADKSLTMRISPTAKNSISLEYSQLPNPASALYLPVHEFLSIYEGFISAYTNRETAFDETYYDLSLALNALPLRGPRAAEIGELIAPLEKAIGDRVSVVQEDGRFYVKLPEGKFEAHLVSEGFRKIAGLIYLTNNGSLSKNGILFWDEPEANLNPKFVILVVELLKLLAANGVQIFLATHDYLLSHELSLLAEYSSETAIKFFALHKPSPEMGVIVEVGSSLAEIEHNPILDEFAAHYDRETALFAQMQTQEQ